MRILVADRNAVLLAAISASFGRHCDLVTATRRDACLEHAERQRFDVVVAGDKLADYTGLELLSEITGLYPETLLIFAASPERLKRLGNRLELFGLLETLTLPLTPRKLLEALKLARRVLRPRAARKVRHVVLESEWDTGERLALVERELEDESAEAGKAVVAGAVKSSDANGDRFAAPSSTTVIEVRRPAVPVGPVVRAASAHVSHQVVVSNDPVFDAPPVPEAPPIEASVPEEPEWAEDGAANDSLFDGKPRQVGTSRSRNAPPRAAAAQSNGTRAASPERSAGKGPKVRRPTKPTAAQLAAFERARARRDAERAAAADPIGVRGRSPERLPTSRRTDRKTTRREPTLFGETVPGVTRTPQSTGSSASLSQLARMAATKQPLAESKLKLSRAAPAPKRAAVVVGSGLAAVLLIGVLTVELLRTPGGAEHLQRTQATASPFTSGASLAVGDNGTPPTQIFSPPPPQAALATAGNAPQRQNVSSDEVIPDPPPPPALEHPGPMEPPSMHSGPALGMVPPNFEPQPDTDQ